MCFENLKTLLLVTSSGMDSIYPFLFEFAKYWASQGRQLLYVSKSRLEYLPPSIGMDTCLPPETLKLMQFMYLPKWSDLMYQLATIRIRSFRVRAIVIDNLSHYFKAEQEKHDCEDHISHVCASLLYAASISDTSPEPVALTCGYISEDFSVEQTLIKNFFHNIWEVEKNETLYKVSKLTEAENNEIILFSYIDDNSHEHNKDRSKAKLHLTEIVKKILDD